MTTNVIQKILAPYVSRSIRRVRRSVPYLAYICSIVTVSMNGCDIAILARSVNFRSEESICVINDSHHHNKAPDKLYDFYLFLM